MKRNTFFEYKRIIRLFGIFGLFSTLLFTSCDGIQTDEIDENTESSSLNYTVSFALANLVGESSEEVERTIYPDQINVDGLSFWLKGTPVKKTGTDDEGEPIWDEESGDNKRSTDDASKDLLTGIKYPVKEELDKASFNLDAGAWQFELKAYDNVEYRKKENGEYTYPKEEAYEEKYLRFESITIVPEIKVGKNTIKFNMKLAEEIPSAFKKGSIDIILDCYLGKKTCSEISKVTASLIGISDPSFNATDDCNGETFTETTYVFDNKPDTEETCVNNFTFTNNLAKDADNEEYRRITYKTNKIPKGIYDLSFDITLKYGDEESNVTVTPYTSVVYVETGSISSLNKKLDKFKQRYTIKYKTVEVSYDEESQENVYLVKDFPPEYFKKAVVSEYNPSSKKPVELPTISSMKRNDKVFLNWYESFDENSHTFDKQISTFTPNKTTTLEEKVFYAEWRDLDIYVSEFATSNRNGSEAFPYKTLNEAINFIGEEEHQNESLEWTIYIIGSVTAESSILSKTVSGSNGISAGKIIIKGKNEKGQDKEWEGADELVSSTNDTDVLKINTDFPVELSYLAIKHNSISGSGTEDFATGCGLKFGNDTVSPTKITLNHVKVFNNEVTGSEGAGISNFMDLKLINCEISNNKAKLQKGQTTGSAGGGIYSRNVLSLTNCVISNNYSGEKGGGIYNSGSLTLTGCTISSNSSVMGGGVQNENEMTISSSTFDSNTVTTNGGAIYSTTSGNKGISDCIVTIADTTFTKNTASSGYGGAIAMICSSDKSASITLNDNVKIGGEADKGNTALHGGGIYISGATTILKITGADVDISWNKAGARGAGIYLEYANLDMESKGTIKKNKDLAESNGELLGGGIFAYYATATIKGSISENAALNGAGLYSEGSSITLTGSIIDNKAENDGGGIYFSDKGADSTADNISITMSDTALVSGNSAKNGGGLYCVSTNTYPTVFAMNGGTVSGNNASENGGGVYIVGGDADTKKFTFNMEAGNISGNTASTNGNTASTNGGGVYIGQYGEMFMYESAVVGDRGATTTSNSATTGGGIYNAGNLYLGYSAADTPVNLNGGLYFNSANNGGGLYNAATGTCYFASGVIASNTAEEKEGVEYTGFGGGVYNLGEVYMHSSAIIGNASAGTYATSENYSNTADYGGGVYNENKFYLGYSSDSDTEGTTLNGGIYYNMATTSGGGIYNNNVNSEFVMLSGYIEDNYASGEVWSMAGGGGAYNKMGTFTMKGGHITCNAANGYGGGVSNLASMFMTGNAVIGFDEDVESVSNYSNLATYGGGVYNNGVLKLGYASTTDTTGTALNGGIFYNASTCGPGGGVFTALTFYMKSGKILNNKASSGKNGLFKSSGNAYIEGGTVQDD